MVFWENFDPHTVMFNSNAVGNVDFAYLCPDPLDVLKAHESGIENCVAALGALNADFLQVLAIWMEERGVAVVEPM